MMLSPADHGLLLGVIGVPALAIIAFYVFCTSYNELIALYLITAWLQCYLYGALWLVGGSARIEDPYVLSVVAGLLIVYILSFILFGGALNRYYGLVARAALAIPPSVIVCALIAWLGFKAILVRRYGIVVFGSMKLRELAGVPHSAVDLDALLLIPAMGAYFTYTIQVAREGRRALRPAIAVLWVVFLLVNTLAETSGGGKRLMILTVLTGFLMLPDRRFRLSANTVAAVLVALLAVGVLSNRYQAVRKNFWTLRSEVTHLELGKALHIILTPERNYETVSEDIAQRPPPTDLLYQITRRQLDGKGLTGGLLIGQAVLNVVPGILVEKKYVDDDERLAEFFNMPHIDYPTTPLAETQAECFLPAYIVVPALYVMLLWMYLALLDRYQSRNWLFSIALIGLVVGVAGSFESSLTYLVGGVRNAAILWCLSAALSQMTRLRLIPPELRAAQQLE
jgi:hypothetical protein